MDELVAKELALLQNYLIVGALLFGIGLIGFLSRRNMIVMFLCVEIMLQGVSLSLVAWGRYHGLREKWAETITPHVWGGQILVIFIITVAACEAAIALALFLMLYRQSGTLDVTFWQKLREDNQPAFEDQEVAEGTPETDSWPKLTTAGVEPEQDHEQLSHRPKI